MNYISTKLLVKKNKDSLIHGQLTDNKGAKNINGEREVSLRDGVGKISHMQRMKPDHSTYKNLLKMDEKLECNTRKKTEAVASLPSVSVKFWGIGHQRQGNQKQK